MIKWAEKNTLLLQKSSHGKVYMEQVEFLHTEIFPNPGFLNSMFGEMLKHAGLKLALSYYFITLKNVLPLHTLSCVAINLDTMYLIPVYVTGVEQDAYTTSSISMDSITNHRQTLTFDDEAGNSSNVMYSYIEGEEWDTFAQKNDFQYSSSLSIELFTVGRYRFHLCFLAQQQGIFTPSVLRYLAQTTRLFASVLRNEFFTDDSFILTEIPFDISEPSAWDMVKNCPGLSEVAHQIEQMARGTGSVLILGETGVGKEVVARAIHERSSRRAQRFVAINCGAITEGIVDSELFGHEKGAFTGAVSTKAGYFEQANGGTIFLDEVGELPLSAQVRLLRVLERHEVQRVGGSHPAKLNIRVIAATNRDLQEMINKGSFREDLLYRLNTFPILVPPLRERRNDIPILARFFMTSIAHRNAVSLVPVLAHEEAAKLCSMNWPGNVRQLSQAVERAILRCQAGGLLNSFAFVESDFTPIPLLAARPNHTAEQKKSPQQGRKEEKTGKAHKNTQPDEVLTLEEMEKQYIMDTLKKTKGRINGPYGAAGLLGLKPNTLRSKLTKLAINPRFFRAFP